MFTSVKLIPPAVNLTVQIFMVFWINDKTSLDLYYLAMQGDIICHFVDNPSPS